MYQLLHQAEMKPLGEETVSIIQFVQTTTVPVNQNSIALIICFSICRNSIQPIA